MSDPVSHFYKGVLSSGPGQFLFFRCVLEVNLGDLHTCQGTWGSNHSRISWNQNESWAPVLSRWVLTGPLRACACPPHPPTANSLSLWHHSAQPHTTLSDMWTKSFSQWKGVFSFTRGFKIFVASISFSFVALKKTAQFHQDNERTREGNRTYTVAAQECFTVRKAFSERVTCLSIWVPESPLGNKKYRYTP